MGDILPHPKKQTIRSLKRSNNYTVYSRQMNRIAFKHSNFRYYYKSALDITVRLHQRSIEASYLYTTTSEW